MAEHPEVIRQQMAETRAHLTEKLEKVENLVTETVQSATEAVSNTVEAVKDTVENVTGTVADTVSNVKDTVADTVHTVTETFNLKRQFERHPWLMFGGAVAVGYLASSLFGSKRHTSGWSWGGGDQEGSQSSSPRAAAFATGDNWTGSQEQRGAPETRQSTQSAYQPAQEERYESPREEKKGWFWNELNHLKNLGLGSLMGVVHDMAVRNLPGELGQKVAEEVDHLTENLGAQPIHGLMSGERK
jgi:ElaB/YqjD/DUF883 family membrane-anchored ribosome-binding protein